MTAEKKLPRLKKKTVIVLLILVVVLVAASIIFFYRPMAPAVKKPVELKVLLTAGFTDFYIKDVIEKFDEMREDIDITATAIGKDEALSRLKAQKEAGMFEKNATDVHLIIVGYAELEMYKKEDLIIKIYPVYKERLNNVEKLIPIAKEYISRADGYGIVTHLGYYGGVFVYRSKFVKDPPESLSELKEWIENNPGRFGYGAPPYSGPGTLFIITTAHGLGEDLEKPETWDKAWEYLKQIEDKVWPSHPPGTGPVIKAFAGGEVWLMPMAIDWGARIIAKGEIPPDSKLYIIKELGLTGEPHFAIIPKGVPMEKVRAALDLINYIISPEAQANELKYYSHGITAEAWDLAPEDLRNEVKKWTGFTIKELLEIPMWTMPSPEAGLKMVELWKEKILGE